MLIGTVEGATLGVISIDDNELKIQSIKLYKIKALIIHERFKMETVTKQFFYSRISKSSKDGWINVLTDSGRKFSMPIIGIYQLISVILIC